MHQKVLKLCLTYCEGGNSGGHNKWEELCMLKMPEPFMVWENALKHVDKDKSRVKKGMVDLGYHIPELALLISGQTPKHCQPFITNWLVICPLWISCLDHNPPICFPSLQLWRKILHNMPSKKKLEAAPKSSMDNRTTKDCKLAVQEIISNIVVAMIQCTSLAPTKTAEWQGNHIMTVSLTNPPAHLIKAILWEVYKISWHYELYTLD